jgi:hypothetical protein
VDELLQWFVEQHAAGVTVRGGKLRPKQQVQQSLKGKAAGSAGAASDGKGKRVQIFQQDALPMGGR